MNALRDAQGVRLAVVDRSRCVIREFARLDGVRVPVSQESIAKLKFAGLSRMVVRYEYETINGRPVSLDARRTMITAARGRE